MEFLPHSKDDVVNRKPALCFIFQKGRLLTKRAADEAYAFPTDHDLKRHHIQIQHRHYLGALDGMPCYAAETESTLQTASGYEFKELRALITKLDETLLWVAGLANQLVHWHQTHLYCGRCGHPTEDKDNERAKICPHCGLINYPRLSPAVIVAVIKGDQILLARNNRFKIPMYSVLAGFVEPGETLEACIHREVKEEVGITVKGLRYFGSQPWPFPDSLMIAYTAEYGGGEIRLDPTEIADARWFRKDDLPQVPPAVSIAGQLIEWFCRR